MNGMKTGRYLQAGLAAVLGALLTAGLCWAAPPGGKPQLPIQVTVGPVQQDVTAESMRSGDVVDLAVTATARADAEEMRIEAKLLGGAELVAGSLSWSGPAAKGETRQLLFSVRLPGQGLGKVRGTVTCLSGGKKVMKRSAMFVLGADQDAAGRTYGGRPAKDAAGREIIEY